MSPVTLGAIAVDCPNCGRRLSCPIKLAEDHAAFARNEARLELHVPEHDCDPGPDPDDGERVAA